MKDLTYRTKQRAVILDFLAAHPERTFDVESLHKALLANGEKVSRTTVYRMLKRLAEEKRIVSFFDEAQKLTRFRFDPDRAGSAGQIELKCSACGKVERLDCSALSSFEAHLRSEHHFRLSCAERVFSGVCENCAGEKTGGNQSTG